METDGGDKGDFPTQPTTRYPSLHPRPGGSPLRDLAAFPPTSPIVRGQGCGNTTADRRGMVQCDQAWVTAGAHAPYLFISWIRNRKTKAGTVQNNSHQQPGLFMESCLFPAQINLQSGGPSAHGAENQTERRQHHHLKLAPSTPGEGCSATVDEQRLTENCYSVKTPHEGKQLCTFLRAGQPHL